ncbi:MAG: serine/threonine-protein kinase [Pirellulales bacterium]
MGFLSKLFGESKVNVHDRFELLREAISGTMSNFYLARDKKNGKVVGLKILDIEKYEAAEARFKALGKPGEGEIGKALVHPLIVETYEYGTTTKGEPYVVLEYLDGPGLNSLIVGKSQPARGKRLNLIRQAAEALGAVHKAGYIHRDVCPRNFVAAKDLNSLKLIDFGLTLPAKPEYMQPGNRTGTPNYMSPEVVRRKKTDHRLDIFSFGVTAYELMAYELPFPKGNATGMAALNHDKLEPVPLADRCPKVDPRLAAAILQCMEALPEKRPQTMDAFLKLIEPVKTEETA